MDNMTLSDIKAQIAQCDDQWKLNDLIDQVYQLGVDEGYKRGNTVGYEEGYGNGYKDGRADAEWYDLSYP